MPYSIVPERSRVWIDARSSLHPIRTSTTGLSGWVDVTLVDGVVDLSAPARGHLELRVDLLRSGNPLEDRELRRRINARRFPTIEGDMRSMGNGLGAGRYLVDGDLTFLGATRRYQEEMTLAVADERTITLAGAATFDVRDFGMEPPRILMLKVEPEVVVRVELVAEKEG